MRLINKSNGDQYFIDLFEKWWHYPLLFLTWFFPHKAYPYKEKDRTIPTKFKFDAKMGLATGFIFILGDIIRKMNLMTLSEEYYWLGKVFAYPLALITLIIVWRILLNHLRKKDLIDFNKYYYVRINMFSLKAIKIYFMRFLVLYFMFMFLSESITLDVFSMFIVVIGTLYFVTLMSIGLVSGVGVISFEDELLKNE